MIKEAEELEKLMFPRFANNPGGEYITASVLNKSQVSGKVVSREEDLDGMAIVVCKEVEPWVFDDPSKIRGIVTTKIKSHYRIVTSAEGIPVAVVKNGEIDRILADNTSICIISIDGLSQRVYLSGTKVSYPDLKSDTLKETVDMIKGYTPISVRVNADTESQAVKGRLFGAEGTGPVRTEYMFFQRKRLPIFQKMLLGKADAEDINYLKECQIKDFEGIYRVMDGYRVCIRLLDPPSNEFFPKPSELNTGLAQKLGLSMDELAKAVETMQESNPMLGLRGSRLGLLRQDIYRMQVEASILALRNCVNNRIDARLEILVPLVMTGEEMKRQYEMIKGIIGEADERCSIGAMIEVPQACYEARNIAKYCKTFSFGTNDLTQCCYGISRDDASFIEQYIENGIFLRNPFKVISCNSVGNLMRLAINEGKNANPDLKIGICGEQASNKDSISFLSNLGVDYIAVSPYKVLTTLAKIAGLRGDEKWR